MPSDGPSIDAQDMQLSPVDEGSTPAILRASSILAAASSAMTHSSTPTPRLTINTRSGTPRAATSCLTPTLQQLKSTDPFISGGFAAEFAGANNVPNVKQEPVRPAVQFSSSTPTPRSAIPLETLKPDLRVRMSNVTFPLALIFLSPGTSFPNFLNRQLRSRRECRISRDNSNFPNSRSTNRPTTVYTTPNNTRCNQG